MHRDALQATKAAQIRGAAAELGKGEQDVVVASLEAGIARVWCGAKTVNIHTERKWREEENVRCDVERKAGCEGI
jgi:hypothetical protein